MAEEPEVKTLQSRTSIIKTNDRITVVLMLERLSVRYRKESTVNH